MLIKDLQVEHRGIPLHTPFKTALRTATEIESIEVKVELEGGITGKGAAAPTWVITGDSTESIQAALLGPIKQALIEQDIYHFQALLDAIQTCCIGNTSAKATADMALYDAYSKLLQVPLYQFLGDKKQLKTSMTVGVDTPEKMVADAEKCVAEGFSSLKIKVGAQPELDIARISAIRRAVPADVMLRLDANQGWKPKQAVQLIKQLEAMNAGIEFIEQPVAARDLDGLKFVTDHVGIPIMADESLFSPKDALQLVSGQYVDLLNIKLMKSGGIANAWKIASLAEIGGVACMIGSMMEPAHSVAAAAHFAAAHPNVIYFDLDAPLWLTETPKAMTYEGEQLYLSGDPGIG
ncbi:dipeptide epimerase [Virgibacillus sp. FSP13]